MEQLGEMTGYIHCELYYNSRDDFFLICELDGCDFLSNKISRRVTFGEADVLTAEIPDVVILKPAVPGVRKFADWGPRA